MRDTATVTRRGRMKVPSLDQLAQAVILSWGWRRRIIVMTAGAVAALAQAPLHLFPLLWLAFPVLVWTIDGAVVTDKTGRMSKILPAFLAGWWFGFGYFLAGLWWVGSAFLVEAETFVWFLPAAILLFPAGLAIFFGFGAAMASLVWREGPSRIAALALGIGSSEWIRAHLMTGFPWNAPGYGLAANEVTMQIASLIGVTGMNVLAVLIFAAPATLAPRRKSSRPLWPTGAALGLLALIALFGAIRLAGADAGYVPNVRLRIVQPSIDQAEKWQPNNRDQVFKSYLTLSNSGNSGLEGITHLIWPESAFPFILSDEPDALRAIAQLLPEGRTLVTGAARSDRTGPQGRPRYFNALYVMDDEARILATYDKTHLVPFGEYLPFQSFLEKLGLEQLTRLRGGFSPGRGRSLLNLPGAGSFSPLICYEIIFSGQVVGRGGRPDFLVNLTNDAWFGRTPGPYQHLHIARVRAVEEGLPVIRAANTGISAVIDASGRLVASAGLGERIALDAPLPGAGSPTLLSRWRFAAILPFVLAGLLLIVGARVHHMRAS